MGSEISRLRMESPLRALLKANGTPLKARTARTFLRAIEHQAPWFLGEGLLRVPQWEYLGEDLRKADAQQPLPTGTMAIWALVRSCLTVKKDKFAGPLKEGSSILEEVKEERSLHSSRSSETGSENGEEEEFSGEELERKVKELKIGHATLPDMIEPPAPPPPYSGSCKGACSRQTSSPWADLSTACFPILDAQNQRFHQPLDFKLVKQLKDAVNTYGPQAAFTVSLLESLAGLNLSPGDWTNLARATLSGGQYLMWKTAWQEYSADTAQEQCSHRPPRLECRHANGLRKLCHCSGSSPIPPRHLPTNSHRSYKSLENPTGYRRFTGTIIKSHSRQ
ncbi:uncharacterized protein LOC122895629 [Neovison vison]|uniref:uncharacterized protein LOC122895629 n=1 Tax=Neovison vison TaxID=452646 RepID=UPI001CF065FD|nr:uncharacterized protein LOC122895629 [Neogale vison]